MFLFPRYKLTKSLPRTRHGRQKHGLGDEPLAAPDSRRRLPAVKHQVGAPILVCIKPLLFHVDDVGHGLELAPRLVDERQDPHDPPEPVVWGQRWLHARRAPTKRPLGEQLAHKVDRDPPAAAAVRRTS